MPEPTIRKTFKFKLRPTPAQAAQLEATLRLCRELYNAALQERRDAWKMCQVSVNYYQQKAQLPDIRAIREDCAGVNAQVLQDVVLRIDRAFKAFFRRVKTGEEPGYPRFKGRNHYHSFMYPQVGAHGCAQVDNGFLVLSKIGRVAMHWSQSLEGAPKTVTISREADGWYACLSCADVPTQPLPLTGQETGIDVGIKSFLALADGSLIENPRHYRKAEKALKHAQRRVSRRKRGSKRRRKAVKLLARKHQKVARQRRDFHHKTALALVRQYDTIYHEAIQAKNLSARPKPKPDGNGGYHPNGASHKAGLNKSIQDAGWSQFLTILTFKAAYAGKRAEAVPSAYTTQECSGCGEQVPKSLSVRTHVCPSCGLVLDRDTNAALNILRVGQTRQALTQTAGSYVA
jgi:putative transposase